MSSKPSPTASPIPASELVSIPGVQARLSKAQKRFNQLIRKIEQADRDITLWTDFLQAHQARIEKEFQPLEERYAQARVRILQGLDRAIDSNLLTRAEMRDCIEALEHLLDEWCDELEGPEIDELVGKYLPEMDDEALELDDEAEAALRDIAAELFGLDPSELEAPPDWDADAAPPGFREPPPQRKKSAKAQQREQQEAQAELDAEAESRKLYRKLVSALHPDREQDEALRQQKTELMQQVNRAFEASDLLTLLRVHNTHVATDGLSDSEDEQLARYNRSLQSQLRAREAELAHLQMPFRHVLMLTQKMAIEPEMVEYRLAAELRSLRRETKDVERDAQLFSDPLAVKAWLRAQREGRRSSRRR